MLVAGPVAGVGEDEDRFDLDFAVVSVSRGGVLFFGQFPERRGVFIVLDDVAGCDYVFEAVAFGHLSAFLAFSAHHEDCSVFLGELAHRRVAADELAGGNFHFELVG